VINLAINNTTNRKLKKEGTFVPKSPGQRAEGEENTGIGDQSKKGLKY